MEAREVSSESYKRYSQLLAAMLFVLLLSFASLVPGGPVENRDFSHLASSTNNGFNTFLIALWMVGFVAAVGVWLRKRVAFFTAIPVAWLYVTVIALDLGKIFPVSPDPTGFALGLIMIIDAILALNIVLFAHKALGHL